MPSMKKSQRGSGSKKAASPKPASPKPASPKPASPKPESPKPASPKATSPKVKKVSDPSKAYCFKCEKFLQLKILLIVQNKLKLV